MTILGQTILGEPRNHCLMYQRWSHVSLEICWKPSLSNHWRWCPPSIPQDESKMLHKLELLPRSTVLRHGGEIKRSCHLNKNKFASYVKMVPLTTNTQESSRNYKFAAHLLVCCLSLWRLLKDGLTVPLYTTAKHLRILSGVLRDTNRSSKSSNFSEWREVMQRILQIISM